MQCHAGLQLSGVFFPFLHDSDLSILRSESTLATCPNFGVHLSSDVPPAAARRARSSGGDRPWRSSGRVTMVAVVQAAHVRHCHDLTRCSRLDASAHGRILAQREMRAPEMVVVDVRSQYSVE